MSRRTQYKDSVRGFVSRTCEAALALVLCMCVLHASASARPAVAAALALWTLECYVPPSLLGPVGFRIVPGTISVLRLGGLLLFITAGPKALRGLSTKRRFALAVGCNRFLHFPSRESRWGAFVIRGVSVTQIR